MADVSDKDRLTAGVVLACYDQFDREWRHLLDLNMMLPVTQGRPPIKVVCRTGCAACCTYLVDTLEGEAIMLAIAIEQADPESKHEALRRLLQWEHEYNRWLRGNPMPPPVFIRGIEGNKVDVELNAAHSAWRARWQVKRKACPFLNMEDHSCGVYELRPATCRGHHAAEPPADHPAEVREPPEGCFTTAEDLNSNRVTAPIWMLNNQLGEQWSVKLGQALMQRHLPWTPGQILPIAVLEAGRERFHWPQPQDVGGEVPVLENARKGATAP
jgi:Fe-S-cluster containining protein